MAQTLKEGIKVRILNSEEGRAECLQHLKEGEYLQSIDRWVTSNEDCPTFETTCYRKIIVPEGYTLHWGMGAPVSEDTKVMAATRDGRILASNVRAGMLKWYRDNSAYDIYSYKLL